MKPHSETDSPPANGDRLFVFRPGGRDGSRDVRLNGTLEAHVGSTEDFHALWSFGNQSGF